MKFAFANFFPLILRGYCKNYPFLINDTPHACGELARHVHDGGARADSSPHTRTYSFLWSAHAGNLLRTCAMGVRVPVTRHTRGGTLFCGAHTRETLSARARWGRACRYLAPRAHVLFFAERTRAYLLKNKSPTCTPI